MKVNDFGAKLDRNGYAPSIVPWPDNSCIICNRTDMPLQRHEVFHGPFRERSKELGCWVHICPECHERLHHKDGRLDRKLKQEVQKEAQWRYKWNVQQFREHFGKNYLEIDQ